VEETDDRSAGTAQRAPVENRGLALARTAVHGRITLWAYQALHLLQSCYRMTNRDGKDNENMAKKHDDALSQRQVERKLKKARLKLEVAQARLQQERQRGKQDIERARLLAAEWEAEALERVEHRSARVSRIESHLTSNGRGTASPTGVAEALESLQKNR